MSLVIAITIRFGVIPAIILGLITGMLIGAINGVITSKLKINAFIVTFAMLGILKGANLLIFESQTNAQSILIDNAVFGNIFNVNVIGVPIVIIIFFILALIAELILRYTKIGFEIYVTGREYRNRKTLRSEYIFDYDVLFFSQQFMCCNFCYSFNIACDYCFTGSWREIHVACNYSLCNWRSKIYRRIRPRRAQRQPNSSE